MTCDLHVIVALLQVRPHHKDRALYRRVEAVALCPQHSHWTGGGHLHDSTQPALPPDVVEPLSGASTAPPRRKDGELLGAGVLVHACDRLRVRMCGYMHITVVTSFTCARTRHAQVHC